uniref:WD_REPEATS_REGION domain-containing protein n=1 Tax=Parastrongyloides trichosuri TaxID=131310 RepID=A0A0N4ZMV3_PARTI
MDQDPYKNIVNGEDVIKLNIIENKGCIDKKDLAILRKDAKISKSVLNMLNYDLGIDNNISYLLWKSTFDKITYLKTNKNKPSKITNKNVKIKKEGQHIDDDFKYNVIAQIRIKEKPLSNYSCYDVKFFKSNGNEPECFVTICKDKIFIYKIGDEGKPNKVMHIGTIVSGNDTEEFSALNVGCIEYKNQKIRVIVAGGSCKVVQVYRATDGILMHNLYGHTGYISSIKFSPIHSDIIITASGDITFRLWNIKHGVQLANFSGSFGHGYDVVDCDFSPCGNYIATVGKDYKALLWGLNDEENVDQKKHLDLTGNAKLQQYKLPEFTKSKSNITIQQKIVMCKENNIEVLKKYGDEIFYPTFRRFPIAVNQVLHCTIIDSVRFFKDYLITKDQSSTVKMWKFGSTKNGIFGTGNIYRTETRYFVLKEFILPKKSETWFRKIALNREGKILAVPSNEGKVFLFNVLEKQGKSYPVTILDHKFEKLKQIEVRNIAFSNNSKYLVSVGDHNTICVYSKF